MDAVSLVTAVAGLVGPSGQRRAAADALAGRLGCDEVRVLVRDPKVRVLLPAPGYTATIRGGPKWRALLAACSAGEHRGTVDLAGAPERPAIALAAAGCAIVLVGAAPADRDLAELRGLLPLLDAALAIEGVATAALAEAAVARETAVRATNLAAALDAERAEAARLNRELQRAHDQKDEFLAMLAHELRNPLAPLTTALHLVRMRLARGQPAEKELDVAARQVVQLSRLVEDLLDVARLTRGRVALRKERVTLRQVLEGAVESARPRLEARRHVLALDLAEADVAIDADPVRLVQVFGNLLHNAAKYTDPGGEVRVTCRRGPDAVEIEVADSGIGIAPDMLDRVFDLFSQVSSSIDRAQGGLGIGLTVVRSLVELHGGTVTVHSAGHGHGSRFVVRLPVPALAPPAPVTQPKVDRVSRPLRILLVEDNVDAALLLAETISLAGHDVRVAHDGLAALHVAGEVDPDVVILDIGLPHLDGNEVARRLRASLSRDVALIALTGYGSEADRRRSAEAGFHHHLVKPIDPAALTRLVESIARPAVGVAGG